MGHEIAPLDPLQHVIQIELRVQHVEQSQGMDREAIRKLFNLLGFVIGKPDVRLLLGPAYSQLMEGSEREGPKTDGRRGRRCPGRHQKRSPKKPKG